MMILRFLSDENVWLRQASVHYAGTIFPSSHVQSRYILLLASGDGKQLWFFVTVA